MKNLITEEQAIELNRETSRYIEAMRSIEDEIEISSIKQETFQRIDSQLVREFMSLVWDDIYEERRKTK